MYTTLIEIPGGGSQVGIHTYGMFIVLAFSVAFLMVHRRAARVGIHPDRLLLNYLAAGVGGLLGARALYTASVAFGTGGAFLLGGIFLGSWAVLLAAFARRAAEGDEVKLWQVALGSSVVTALIGAGVAAATGNSSFVVDFVQQVFSPATGGFAIYGGVIGGAVAVMALCQVMGIDGWKAADLAAPAVIFAMGIGRFGCFFAGCCHGVVAEVGDDPMPLLPEGLLGGQIWISDVFPFVTTEFHTGVGRLLDQPLYPTQALAVVVLCSMGAFLYWAWQHRRFDGQMAALALIIEPPTRILLEAYRADERGYAFTWEVSEEVARYFPGMTQAGENMGMEMGLTTSQTLGLGAMALGVVLMAMRWSSGRDDEVEAADAGDPLLDELIAE